jgi:hypothetical protein
MAGWERNSVGKSTYGKVVHVGQEDVDLDDLGDVGASGLNDGLEVLAALSSLLADSALDEGQIRGDGDLARAVDGRWGLDGLRLYANLAIYAFRAAVRALYQALQEVLRRVPELEIMVLLARALVVRRGQPLYLPGGALVVETISDIVELSLWQAGRQRVNLAGLEAIELRIAGAASRAELLKIAGAALDENIPD